MEFVLVISTAGSKAEADKIATALLEKRAAACIQQMPIISQYRWAGKVQKSDEILLFIKTRVEYWEQVQKIIKSEHSYEVPEIIRLTIDDGLPEYLDWIKRETI